MSSGPANEMNAFVQGASRIFLQPILPLLDDKSVTEIMINAHDKIYVERKGKVVKSEIQFPDEKAVAAAANIVCQFVGKSISKDNPRVDARLPDGSRVHIIGPPACKNVCFSIRRFPDKPLTTQDLLKWGAVTKEVIEFVELCVEMHLNMVVAGGTGSGKTSLLNALGRAIPASERILIIEDTSELQILQDHVVRLEARPPDEKGKGGVTIRELLHSALRMRPDRIVIGEIRAGEALDLIQAMTSGHSGALTTVHATTPLDTLSRLETLCLYADTGLPLTAIRMQVSSAINIIVQTARLRDGSRKLTGVTEVLHLDAHGNHRINPLFKFEVDSVDEQGKIIGAHRAQGNLPSFFDDVIRQGYPLRKELFSRDGQEPKLPEGTSGYGSH
jgi:pilus assembly protein CpaF